MFKSKYSSSVSFENTKPGYSTRRCWQILGPHYEGLVFIDGGYSLKGKQPHVLSDKMLEKIFDVAFEMHVKVVRQTKNGIQFSFRKL